MTRILGILVGLALGLSALVLAAPGTAHALVDRDCGDFSSQAAAQKFFVDQGGPQSDPHRLDADGDGVVCETNPCPCSSSTSGGGGASPATSSRQRARVIAVIDGDTVDVRLPSGRKARVRMLGIDTPEMSPRECGAAAATRSLRTMLPRGTRVVLVTDPTQARRDRYGRLLRYVMRGTTDTNRVQVARGWARVYVYGGTAFQRVAKYRSAQATARNQGRGTWGAC